MISRQTQSFLKVRSPSYCSIFCAFCVVLFGSSSSFAMNDAVKAERDLMSLLPKKEWIQYSHRMIHHGRKVCKARTPQCDVCRMNDICPQVGV